MKTLRKNTREYKTAKNGAKIVKRYDLENGFTGKIQEGIDESYFDDAKITKHIGFYRLNVHSNLWFDWSVS